MYWLLAASWTITSCAVAALLLASNHTGKVETEALKYRQLYRAARWLAQWNYSRTTAMQEVMAAKLTATFREVSALADKEAALRPWFSVGQTIPTKLMPGQLREAGDLYNREVFTDWPQAYAEPVLDGRESPEQARVRQLQDALAAFTRAAPEAVLEDIAATGGFPYRYAELTAQALHSRALWDLGQVLGEAEAEEVLPSRY